MALDGCGLLCKYVLIFFNILFALAGIAMLGLGLWLRFSNDTKGIFEIEILNKSTFVIVVIGLIVMGSVMLFVVAFGDYGACNENRCALAVFSALLAVLAVAGVVAGVLTYTHGDEVGAQLAEFYTSMYGLYVAKMFMAKIDPAGLVTLSVFHHVFQCCGVLGALEIPVRDFCPERDGIVAKLEMPPCPVAIYDAFKTKAPMVLGFFLGLGALLITALVCTIILLKQIRRNQQELTDYYTAVY